MALLSSIKKDLQWRLADPMSLAIWIGIPLMIGALMSMVSGGRDGIRPKAHVLLVNHDDSALGELLGGAIGGAGGEFLKLDEVKAAEGRRRIDAGDGSALLVVPQGFLQSAIDDKPVELELVTNPSQQILPKIVQEALEMFAEASFYLQRTGGDVLRDMTRAPPKGQKFPPLAQILATSRKIYDRMQTLELDLFPPSLTVADELTDEQQRKVDAEASDSNTPSFNLGLLLFPGILFMSMMFMAQGISYDLWREKDQGTLARILCSPAGASTFLLAKAVSGMLLMSCVSIAGLALGYFAFSIPGRAIPGALAWCAFCGTCMLILFFIVQMLASSSRGANVLSTAVLFPLMMIGGTFFPFEAMPKSLASVGQWTPNGIAVIQLKRILAGELELAPLLTAAASLAAIGLLLFGLATRMLRARFARA